MNHVSFVRKVSVKLLMLGLGKNIIIPAPKGVKLLSMVP